MVARRYIELHNYNIATLCKLKITSPLVYYKTTYYNNLTINIFNIKFYSMLKK